MKDPLVPLVMSVYSSPGVYALLLGSGISRSAGIPTGWEIVLDLIRKVAKLRGQDPGSDPETWYRKTVGEEPTYTRLLASLAKTPSERSALLRAYFEPTEAERAEGLKVPTQAHRSIATLVKDGFIKMILTTNFDRLLETAVEEQGIVPDVISSDDSLKGAIPHIHSRCTILKLHGDYKDSRIRNTPRELGRYSKHMTTHLDSILDEFGLIICGWSGEWDHALRNAILRSPARRFSAHWITRGHLTEAANQIIKQRRASVIEVDSADQFFNQLAEKLQTLRELETPHPMSVRMAVATVKRYLADDRFRIRLHDLVFEETERLYAELASQRFATQGPQLNAEIFQSRMREYEAVSTILLATLITLTYHDEKGNSSYLTRIVQRLSRLPRRGGYTALINLQLYPALLVLYGAGIAAVAAQRYRHLAALLVHPESRDDSETQKLVERLHVWSVFEGNAGKWVPRADAAREFTPANNHIFDVMRESLQSYLPDDRDYQTTFDIFEYLLGLTYIDLTDGDWGPVGCFRWRYGRFQSDYPPIEKFIEHGLSQGTAWALLQAGLFGGSVKRLESVRTKYNNFLAKIPWF